MVLIVVVLVVVVEDEEEVVKVADELVEVEFAEVVVEEGVEVVSLIVLKVVEVRQ